MDRVKQIFLLLFRLALTFIVMSVAYIVSTMVIGTNNITMTPEEANQAGKALFLFL